jgi:hypothetical protein
MSLLSAITFVTPWALAGLLALPIIWWLLRFTPPRPQLVKFPPVRLLLGLIAREEQPDKPPWWLLLLRLALAALVILGVAHPIYAPGLSAASGNAPLLLIVDNSWAAAADWPVRRSLIEETLRGAERRSALTAVATTAPTLRPASLELAPANETLSKAMALEPQAIAADRLTLLAQLNRTFANTSGLRIVWLADGLDGDARIFAEGLMALGNGGAALEVMAPGQAEMPFALARPVIEGGRIKVKALRVAASDPAEISVSARARNGRSLAEAKLGFEAGKGAAEADLDLPLELRNEVSRLDIASGHTAGGVFLLDDRWRRKTVALYAGASVESAQPLLAPLYYVQRALEPYAEISTPQDYNAVAAELDRGVSILTLADVGIVPPSAREAISAWIEKGGVLVRFAGPRLASGEDGLLPVTLRAGDRSLGSALSWDTPQPLQSFADASPFAGLAIDPDIRITRQVLAEPDADLPGKVWAALTDGTPLVTADRRGKGLIVFVHVTANTDWSNLPISGLFVEMLRRILDIAPGAGGGAGPAAESGTVAAFTPLRALTGYGELSDPPPEAQPIAAADIDRAVPTPSHPAGLYWRGGAERAINISPAGDALVPLGGLPSGAQLRGLEPAPVVALAPALFTLAFLLFLLDCLAAIAVSGTLQRLMRRGTAAAALALIVLAPQPIDARAQQPADSWSLQNALTNRLAFVITGNAETDERSEKGMEGLSQILAARTSVEPGSPVGVDVERDELVFFPLIYWPVRPNAEALPAAALARVNAYMRNGGTILFDTQEDGLDANSLAGGTSPGTEALRRILAGLDIPPLETVPPEHVLTKSFYLLSDFPGRYDRGPLWVERPDISGMTTGNADGVSTIIIGSNDYAGAWAMDTGGNPLYATVPGGERQRELSYRVGINIVMYALTGNYKTDQVHIPQILERLGQ